MGNLRRAIPSGQLVGIISPIRDECSTSCRDAAGRFQGWPFVLFNTNMGHGACPRLDVGAEVGNKSNIP